MELLIMQLCNIMRHLCIGPVSDASSDRIGAVSFIYEYMYYK
jgi:hypothetical protein